MRLNELIKSNKKKLDQEEELAVEKAKHLDVDIKDKKPEEVLQSKVLREDKCHFTEDCLKEALNH
jgi:rRNA-processing protein FCF1